MSRKPCIGRVSIFPRFLHWPIRFNNGACVAACGVLDFLYGSNLVLAQNTPAYTNATQVDYWSSQQRAVEPSCIFNPSTDSDVSVLILLSRLTGCPFAVKSGGHAAFTGASNIQNGITVWLKNLNEITLSEDKTVVAVGAGLTAVDIYSALESEGLATVSGRVSSIGVGGFTTGGGISYFSNLVGWALDNVESYEVAIPWGEIVTASETENPDLYWALRGGGNNFGIVPKFNLYTVECTKLWGGEVIYLESEFAAVIDAFIDVVNNAEVDGHAQQYVAFLQEDGLALASAELTYVKNVTWPAVFESYQNISSISDSTEPKTLVQYVLDIQDENPYGLREVYWPHAFQFDVEFANWAVDYFYSVLPLVTNITGVNPVLIYQGISVPILNNMANRGGNALGLNATDGPLHLMHIACSWDNESDDAIVYTFVTDFWNTVKAKAKELGIYNNYIYMNYASQYQDVIAGYGATNKARLQSIAAAYDPQQVFQTL